MESLVSIIIPVYGVEEYLQNSIKSVTEQTHKNLQIILVDDGSPDKCGEMCDALAEKDSRITVIHKENGGVSSARNAGLDLAEGKWIYFMDPDDTIEPETIEEAVNTAESTDTDMCFFDFEYIEKKGNRRSYSLRTEERVIKDLSSGKNLEAYLFCGSSCFCVIKGDMIRKSGLRFKETMIYGEDMIFRVTCYTLADSFSYIPKVFYHYFVRSGSAAHSDNADYGNRAIRLYNELKALSEKYSYPDNMETLISTYLINLTCMVSERLFINCSAADIKSKISEFESFIYSEEFENAAKNCRKGSLNKTAKLCLLLRRYRIIASAAVFAAVKIKRIYKKTV